jgi:lactate racemase
MTVNIPCGDSALAVSLRGSILMGILENKKKAPANVKKLLLKSLRQKKIPFGKKKVLIVVPDATRSAHLREILPILLGKMSIPSRTIDIIIATGMHKAHTYGQLAGLLGPSVLRRCKVLQHDAVKGAVINLGWTRHGVPVTLDKSIKDYDYIISIGVIEPHLYAGYSGGAKTIAIGLAGQSTINATHGIRFLDSPGVTIGSLEGNIFQETLWHIIENIGPVFSINIVNNSEGKALKIFSGPVGAVFNNGCEFAKKVFEVKVKESSDIAICGIGRPKDVNLYQASRALNYVLSVGSPVVRKGGVVIVAAELRDGIGPSPAEKRFYEELKNMRSSADFVNHIKINGCVAGEHRTYMVAKVLLDYNVVFVTGEAKSFMDGLPFRCFHDISEALQFAQALTGQNAKTYVIPRALATIATLDSA